MDDLEISAAAIGWDDEAREALSNPRLSPGDDPIMAVEWYEREVREGRVNQIGRASCRERV